MTSYLESIEYDASRNLEDCAAKLQVIGTPCDHCMSREALFCAHRVALALPLILCTTREPCEAIKRTRSV